jgi:uncharacterized protein (DUF3084 family)
LNEAEAIAALSSDDGEQAGVVNAPGPESTEQTAPVAAEPEFLPRADLDSLLEGVADPTARERIETAYRSMNGDYTRKTQELAEQRKAFEGLDPHAAREAYEFVSALQSDRDFALQVHKELSGALESAGLTPVQAQAEATRQIVSATESELDPSDPVVRELNELKQWRQQQDMELQRRDMIREIERQDSAIRRSNPSYADEDMEVIYKLAASTSGDLFAAQEYFEKEKSRIVNSYQASKASVPTGTAPVSGSVNSETPLRLTNMEDAHKAAVDRLQQILGAE